jgi:concentrative nucleoside transporter, CNT family
MPPALPVSVPLPPTPITWRLGIAAAIIALAGGAYLLQPLIGTRGQAIAGVFCFFGIVAVFSANLRAVNWRTIGWGVALQILLAVLVLKVGLVKQGLENVRVAVDSFISFSDKGADFVFGNLADSRPADAGGTWSRLFPMKDGKTTYRLQFAFKVLPPILFMSAFFTVLYHFGILQWCVRLMALVMVRLMRTSGAETLSVAANVFMGQTEAPLIIKPYVPRMTNSELFTLMTSGMAHISGALMVVYISYGADAVAVLTTCVMACPCSLYLSKLFLPETAVPETLGTLHAGKEKSPYVNAIDAAASGTTDGLRLALNVAAMLIVFIAFVAMFDGLLGLINPDLKLQKIFGWIFSPAAFLMGIDPQDVDKVGSLLGSKLAINEHYAYLDMREMKELVIPAMTKRSFTLTAFALTGFANFASVGIQLGGIGALAPERRHDLARLGGRALFVGFVATLLNAAIAGVLLDLETSS